jgi:hypothetical protein
MQFCPWVGPRLEMYVEDKEEDIVSATPIPRLSIPAWYILVMIKPGPLVEPGNPGRVFEKENVGPKCESESVPS